jgi:hypothetical protein
MTKNTFGCYQSVTAFWPRLLYYPRWHDGPANDFFRILRLAL